MEHQIEIYKSVDNSIELQVSLDKDTVWLTQEQLVLLFQRDQSVISRHIRNVFSEGELEEKSNMQKMHIANSDKSVNFYNLDVIISVGYRVNSKQGTQFRQWATQRLKDYLVQGYAINKKRLQEASDKFQDLKNAVTLAAKAGNAEALTSVEAKGILGVIAQYAYALETLDKYDHQKLTIETAFEETKIQKLTYENAIEQVRIWRDFQKAGNYLATKKTNRSKVLWKPFT